MAGSTALKWAVPLALLLLVVPVRCDVFSASSIAYLEDTTPTLYPSPACLEAADAAAPPQLLAPAIPRIR